MVSNEVVLKARKRDEVGKKLNALRAAGDTPAVVHDHGKSSIHIAVPHKELKRAFDAAGKHAPVSLTVDDKKYVALIKDVAFKPATQIITHTVFQAVKANETVSAEVPLKIIGEIPAERAGLLVVNGVDRLEVEALPKDLVDVIEIDGSVLIEAGDKLTVADIKAPAGVTIKTDSEQLVAGVEMPRDQIAEADAAAAEQASQDSEASGEETAPSSESADEAADEKPAEK